MYILVKANFGKIEWDFFFQDPANFQLYFIFTFTLLVEVLQTGEKIFILCSLRRICANLPLLVRKFLESMEIHVLSWHYSSAGASPSMGTFRFFKVLQGFRHTQKEKTCLSLQECSNALPLTLFCDGNLAIAS